MNRLQWWFRLVGVFYILLALMNLYGIFINPQFFRDIFPYAVDENGIRAATELWLAFVLDLAVTGPILIWAAREPLKHTGLVWLIIWLEIIRGIVDDIYLITKGYEAGGYIGFIVIHGIIIVSGYVFMRQARLQTAANG